MGIEIHLNRKHCLDEYVYIFAFFLQWWRSFFCRNDSAEYLFFNNKQMVTFWWNIEMRKNTLHKYLPRIHLGGLWFLHVLYWTVGLIYLLSTSDILQIRLIELACKPNSVVKIEGKFLRERFLGQTAAGVS